MEFWTTLIRVTEELNARALKSLEANCTHVAGDYWIMEGDVDVLRYDGVVCDEVAEGAVGSLGGLTERQLRQVCLDSYGINLTEKR